MDVQGIFASTTGNLVDSSIEGGDHSVVVSVVENRAREICICKIDTRNVSYYSAHTRVYRSDEFLLILDLLCSEFGLGDIYSDRQPFVQRGYRNDQNAVS